MSLRFFHLFFVAASILMSWLVAAWGLDRYLEEGSTGAAALGLACLVLGFVLVVYFVRVYRKLKELPK